MKIADKLLTVAENEQKIHDEVVGQSDLIAQIKAKVNSLPEAGGGGTDALKTLLDTTKSTQYWFYEYRGQPIDGVIPYNATENVENMRYMFYNSYIAIAPSFDTSSVTDMYYMFSDCSRLTEVPLYDTSKVENMQRMFYYCSNLQKVPLFNTSNVTNIRNMFSYCSKLTEIILLDTSNVTDIHSAFRNCTELTKVVLGKSGTKMGRFYYVFTSCSKLELIHFKEATGIPTLPDLATFDGVPSTCKLVVPDALFDSWKAATNWSAINVVWVKESEYTGE